MYVERRTRGGKTVYFLVGKWKGKKRTLCLGQLYESFGRAHLSWGRAFQICQEHGIKPTSIGNAKGLWLAMGREDRECLTEDQIRLAYEIMADRSNRMLRKGGSDEWWQQICRGIEQAQESGSEEGVELARVMKSVVSKLEQVFRAKNAPTKARAEQEMDRALGEFNLLLLKHRIAFPMPFKWDPETQQVALDGSTVGLMVSVGGIALLGFIQWLNAGGVSPRLGVCETCNSVYVKESGQDRRKYCYSEDCRRARRRERYQERFGS